MDVAQEREQADRERAIAAARARIAASFLPPDADAATVCIECKEPIEPDRLKVLRTSRCFECARIHEMRARSGRP